MAIDISEIFQDVAPGQVAPPAFACAFFTKSKVSYCSNILEMAAKDAIFDLGSVTKMMATTSMVMKLAEQGLLDLDLQVSKYLPFSSFEKFTVKDLLLHRAGLWEWWPLYAAIESPDQLLDFISSKELRYAPGSEWHYSDLGFILLSEVIKRVSGETLPKLFDELVKVPLGLTNTQFASPSNAEHTTPSSFGDRAEYSMLESNLPYPINIPPSKFKGWRTQILKGEINDGNAFHLMGGVSGHAGLFSSLEDLVTFGRQLITAEHFSNLADFSASVIDPVQGLGFRRFGKQFECFGHTGYPGIAVVVDPVTEKGFAFGTNRLLVDGNPVPTMSFLPPLLDLLTTGDI